MSLKLLHPFVVHFPIAFYFLELVLLCVWAVRKEAGFYRFSEFSFLMGYFFMLWAVVTGLVGVGGFSRLEGQTKRHFDAAAITLGFYTLRLLYLKSAKNKGGVSQRVQIAGALIGNAIVFYTAFLGGQIVYS